MEELLNQQDQARFSRQGIRQPLLSSDQKGDFQESINKSSSNRDSSNLKYDIQIQDEIEGDFKKSQLLLNNEDSGQKDVQFQHIDFPDMQSIGSFHRSSFVSTNPHDASFQYNYSHFKSKFNNTLNNNNSTTLNSAQKLNFANNNRNGNTENNNANYSQKNNNAKVIMFQKPTKLFDDLIPDNNPNKTDKKPQQGLIYQCLKYVQPIKSENKWMLGWEMFISVLTILKFFTIPLHVFFDRQNGEDIFSFTYQPFTLIMIFLLTIDICLRFFRCYYDLGIAITDWKKIQKHYLKGLFITDIIVYLSLYIELTEFGFDHDWISMMFYLRFVNLNKFSTKLMRILQLHRKLKAFYHMLKLVLFIIFVCHLFACFFYGIHIYIHSRFPNEKTWITVDQKDRDLLQSSQLVKYINALYWSATTIVTVGYGDVTPQNNLEMVYTTIVMITSTVVFGVVINVMYQIFEDMRDGDRRYERNYSAIGRFMRDKGVKQNFQLKVGAFLEFHIKERNREKNKENYVIQSLPPAIRVKLIYRAYGKSFFGKIPWIKKQILPEGFDKKNKQDKKGLYIFSKAFLMELSTHIKEIHYTEGELIYKQNDSDDIEDIQNQSHCLYYVVRGSLQEFIDKPLYNNGKGIEFRQFQKGDYFGELSFITGQDRVFSVKAMEYCTIYKISKKNFLTVLQDYPQDYEKYCSLRDKLIFSKQYQILQQKCIFCQQQDHIAVNCYKAHYVVNKKDLVQQNQKVQKQRQSFKRYDRPKLNIRSLLQLVQEDCQKIQDNIINLEIYDTDQDEEDDDFESVAEDVYDCFEEHDINNPKQSITYTENLEDQEDSSNEDDDNNNNQENEMKRNTEEIENNNNMEEYIMKDNMVISELEEEQENNDSGLRTQRLSATANPSEAEAVEIKRKQRKKKQKKYECMLLSQVKEEEDIRKETEGDIDNTHILRKSQSLYTAKDPVIEQFNINITNNNNNNNNNSSGKKSSFMNKSIELLEDQGNLLQIPSQQQQYKGRKRTNTCIQTNSNNNNNNENRKKRSNDFIQTRKSTINMGNSQLLDDKSFDQGTPKQRKKSFIPPNHKTSYRTTMEIDYENPSLFNNNTNNNSSIAMDRQTKQKLNYQNMLNNLILFQQQQLQQQQHQQPQLQHSSSLPINNMKQSQHLIFNHNNSNPSQLSTNNNQNNFNNSQFLSNNTTRFRHKTTVDSDQINALNTSTNSIKNQNNNNQKHVSRSSSQIQQNQMNLLLAQLLLSNNNSSNPDLQNIIQQLLIQNQQQLFNHNNHHNNNPDTDQELLDIDLENKEIESFDIDKLQNFGNYMKDFNPKKIVRKVQQENKRNRQIKINEKKTYLTQQQISSKKENNFNNKENNNGSPKEYNQLSTSLQGHQPTQPRMSFSYGIQKQQEIRKQIETLRFKQQNNN